MEIRTWKKEDVKPLIKLCEIMWSESKFKDIPFSEERLQKQFDYLLKNDFKCFTNVNSDFAMTAHILFKKIDVTR